MPRAELELWAVEGCLQSTVAAAVAASAAVMVAVRGEWVKWVLWFDGALAPLLCAIPGVEFSLRG